MRTTSPRYYFSTRDLLMLAALAALGGVTSTYINAIGRMIQSLVGVPGGFQWAAGLHVLWLTLAVGLTGKQGAGTMVGLLKGAVELLTGNTHGLLIVLVDVVAGVLVDIGFLPFRDKDRLPGYLLAGGLASASNVFVFQLFAALPADILSYGAIVILGVVAGLSGVVFAGFLAHILLAALRRAGVVKDRPPQPMGRRAYPIFLASAVLLTAALTGYLFTTQRGAATVAIGGAVTAPYAYPETHGDLPAITAASALRGVTTRYTGVPVRDLLTPAEPAPDADLLLVQAADGYAFFISMTEVQTSTGLLLASQGRGQDASYDIVGAANSKAWVRGVTALTVIGRATLDMGGAVAQPTPYNPVDWQFAMDSITLDVGDGPYKVQGALLNQILLALQPAPDATSVVLTTPADLVSLPLADVLGDDDIRLFNLIGETTITFAVARMDGTVIAPQVTAIEVK